MSPTVRAILLAEAGRYDEAADAFAVAADHLEESTERGPYPARSARKASRRMRALAWASRLFPDLELGPRHVTDVRDLGGEQRRFQVQIGPRGWIEVLVRDGTSGLRVTGGTPSVVSEARSRARRIR